MIADAKCRKLALIPAVIAVFLFLASCSRAPQDPEPSEETGAEPEYLLDRGTAEKTRDDQMQSRDAIRFCVDWFSDGRECLSRKELLAGQIIGEPGSSLTGEKRPVLTIVHPDDVELPAQKVTDCASYADLKSKNWGPLTSADMAMESRFLVHCGLLEMAKRADVPQSSPFAAARLSIGELKSVDPAEWPYLGEIPPSVVVAVNDQAGDDSQEWVIGYGEMETHLSEIAHADFNADGKADILVFLTTRPAGGTAVLNNFALVEKDGEVVRLTVQAVF